MTHVRVTRVFSSPQFTNTPTAAGGHNLRQRPVCGRLKQLLHPHPAASYR